MALDRFRRQLPVYSPLTGRILVRGIAGLLASRQELESELEDRIRAAFSSRGSLLTDSGTSALTLALEPLPSEPPGAVALPAYCCYDVATAADGAGVPVVLYDLDPDTLSPDPSSLEAALSAGPAALVIAHLYGIPVEMDSVRSRSRAADVLLVEDAAQALGASYGGAPLGSFGDLSTLSFGRGKGLSGGGGGALLANHEHGDARLGAARSRVGRDHGRGWAELAAAVAQWLLGRPALYGFPAALPFLSLGETTYEAPSDVSGAPSASLALVSAAWDLARAEAEIRRRNAERLRSALKGTTAVRPVHVPPDGTAGYLRLPVIARSRHARARLASPAARRRGVMPGYPKPLHHLAGFRPRIRHRDGDAPEDFPGAEALCRRLFTVPVHSRLTDADLDVLVELLAAD